MTHKDRLRQIQSSGVEFSKNRQSTTQKERLNEIKKRHTIEQRKKRIKTNRIVFATGVLAALLVIILIIVGAVKGISGKIEAKKAEEARIAAEEQARLEAEKKASEEAAYTPNPNEVDQRYYAKSAFVGNSFFEDLFLCDFLDDADYFYKTGLSVDKAMTEAMTTGVVPVVEELDTDKEYKRIFLMFGENELGWDEDTFVDKYGVLIDKVKKYQPNAKIYLLSITPITKKESDKNIDNTNNDQIVYFNGLIEDLAKEKDCTYADIAKAVADKDGVLPANAATDGVHFGKDYHEKCLLYIQNHYK